MRHHFPPKPPAALLKDPSSYALERWKELEKANVSPSFNTEAYMRGLLELSLTDLEALRAKKGEIRDRVANKHDARMLLAHNMGHAMQRAVHGFSQANPLDGKQDPDTLSSAFHHLMKIGEIADHEDRNRIHFLVQVERLDAELNIIDEAIEILKTAHERRRRADARAEKTAKRLPRKKGAR